MDDAHISPLQARTLVAVRKNSFSSFGVGCCFLSQQGRSSLGLPSHGERKFLEYYVNKQKWAAIGLALM